MLQILCRNILLLEQAKHLLTTNSTSHHVVTYWAHCVEHWLVNHLLWHMHQEFVDVALHLITHVERCFGLAEPCFKEVGVALQGPCKATSLTSPIKSLKGIKEAQLHVCSSTELLLLDYTTSPSFVCQREVRGAVVQCVHVGSCRHFVRVAATRSPLFDLP